MSSESPDKKSQNPSFTVNNPLEKNVRQSFDSLNGLSHAERMNRIIEQATEISTLQLSDLLIPILKFYQKWVNELSTLCVSIGSSDAQVKVSQIERKHIVGIKPTLKNLALFEAYGLGQPTTKGCIYTKTVGLIPRVKELPKDVDKRVKTVFNSAKTAGDLLRDTELQDGYRQTESKVVEMLASLITESDENKVPLNLSLDSMRGFLLSYETMRDREKRLASLGF